MKLLITIVSLITFSLNAQAESTFLFQGKAINPYCIALFNQSMVDKTMIYDINLDHCQNSNAASDEANKDLLFSYNVIGKTKNGLYVVNTAQNFGGSGNFTSLLLLKFERRYYYELDDNSQTVEKIPYTALVYRGNLGGGDRFTNSFADLEIEGNQLIGERYNERNPAGVLEYPNVPVKICLADVH